MALGEGKRIWDICHIWLHTQKILSDELRTFGKNANYFLETGKTSWLQISGGIAGAGYKMGLLGQDVVGSITLGEMEKLPGAPMLDQGRWRLFWGSK